MRRIKKRELGRFHFDKEVKNSETEAPIEELVDSDGSYIEGDRNAVNNSEIETAPQQTTDDFAQSGIQPNNFFYGIYGTPYSRGGTLAVESKQKAIEIIERIIKEGENN